VLASTAYPADAESIFSILIEFNYGKMYLFQVIKERREEYKIIHKSQKENMPCEYAFLAFK
jgi:hypothetical protein